MGKCVMRSRHSSWLVLPRSSSLLDPSSSALLPHTWWNSGRSMCSLAKYSIALCRSMPPTAGYPCARGAQEAGR